MAAPPAESNFGFTALVNALTKMHKKWCVSATVTQLLRDRFQAGDEHLQRQCSLCRQWRTRPEGLDKHLSFALTSKNP